MIALAPNPSWLTGVEYDHQTRQHRLDGRRVPSVTQALDLAYPHRFAHVPPAVLHRKAAIGTAVHRAAQYHAEHDLDTRTLATEVRPRFAAWRWLTENRQVDPLLCETVVCSRDLGLPRSQRRPYVGRLDFLCVVDRRRLVLLDIKTGDAALAQLQTLAYLDALLQQYPDLVAVHVERWAVCLGADGRYQIHTFTDDAADARRFRQVLVEAYTATEWSPAMIDDTHRSTEPPLELPTDEDLGAGDPLFDLPDDAAPIGPTTPTPPPDLDLPPEVPSLPPAGSSLVLSPAIHELQITPDVDAYLTHLEAAIAPFEAAAQAFAREMATTPIDTPDRLAAVGRQSLFAKEREKQIEAVFEPAIRKPRGYLDRVYALKRRVLDAWKEGGSTAARRYTTRQREVEELDRRARAEVDRMALQARQEAQRRADEAKRTLSLQAAEALRQGDQTRGMDLIDQARAIGPAPVAPVEEPVALAEVSKVGGLGTRVDWKGEITDITVAVLTAARPHLLREIADALADGALTPGGGQSITTHMISTKLRAMAAELPYIPFEMFAANDDAVQRRADADRDTLTWPGFRFFRVDIPVRRLTGRGAGRHA